MARITEHEIAQVVIAICNDRSSGGASIAELIEEIPNRVKLSAEDLEMSTTRPNEPMWHRQVRNITSHKKSPGNAIHDGNLVAISGGLALPGSAAAAA